MTLAGDERIEAPQDSIVLANFRSRMENVDATFSEKINAATCHIAFGDIEYARALLETLIHVPPGGQFAKLRLCRRIERGQALLNSGGPARASIMVAMQDGAQRVVIVFAGRNGRYFVPGIFDRSDTSFIFLRDPGACRYLDGILGLGPDYDACIHGILRIVAAMTPTGAALPIYCIGSSSGAYAAVRFGLDLGGRAVLFFSGPTAPPPRREVAARNDPSHAQIGAAPDFAADLRVLYSQAARPPKLTLCFGELHPADAKAAQRMADLPGVTLFPLPGFSGHGSVWESIQTRQFGQLFEALLAA